MTALAAEAPGRVASLLKPFGPEALAKAVRRLLATQEKDL
jgi:DNA-binding NtrC family response regulator